MFSCCEAAVVVVAVLSLSVYFQWRQRYFFLAINGGVGCFVSVVTLGAVGSLVFAVSPKMEVNAVCGAK